MNDFYNTVKKEGAQITIGENNHNIYLYNNCFYSIANNNECRSSHFCKDIKYLISIIYKNKAYKKEDFTKYGYDLILNYLRERNYSEFDLFNLINN